MNRDHKIVLYSNINIEDVKTKHDVDAVKYKIYQSLFITNLHNLTANISC